MITEQSCIDLHCHSTASDGALSPAELITRAKTNGVDVLAITDHDTVAGLTIAKQFNLGLSQPITLVNGVEISTHWHAYDIHIVGLAFDCHYPPLLAFLERQRCLRNERAQEIGHRLEKAGIMGAYQGAQALAGDAALSRGHYARYLVQAGIVDDIGKVFKRYLARGKTGYVPNNWGDMRSAIDVIHAAGGIAVLAHASGYQLKGKWLKKLVREFKEAGGDAMEVVLGQQSPEDLVQLAQLANLNGLKASVGSDFHFPGRWLELGKNLRRPKGLEWVWQSEQWTVKQ
ncbi:PHP domain-containing protein [Shewanella sp. A32]|uniref:RNase RNM n=1 Tax=Shewanella sp. A32 TaxID=3031327 RepID=UPI0023B886A7|nr:PHP domain-containing protein [Shewanella sp. A32]MDF0535104.1 PHP domain-containing protein [Shewanella sp. A32]